MLINEKHLSELNSPIQTIQSRVELHKGSTLEKICTCNDYVSNFIIERVGEGKFFGYGISHKLIIKFIDPNRDLNLTNIDFMEITFGVDGDFIYPFPTFYVYQVDRDETTNEISVIAWDLLYNAVNYKVSELDIETPYNLNAFTHACAALLGVPLKIVGVDENILNTYFSQGANFDGTEDIRTVLNAIAEVTQTIYYINGDWELTFKKLNQNEDSVLTIDKSRYIELKSGAPLTLSGIEHVTELGNNISGGLKANASGNVIFLNDVSDKHHNIVTTINSKNLIKYPYLETLPITREGITFSNNGDGGIKITGTATGFAVFRLSDGSFLEDGKSYLLSKGLTIGSIGDAVNLHIAYYNENNEVKYFSNSPMVWSDKYKFQQCYIQVKPNTVCNGEVIYPAINYGSGYGYAEFTHYVDINNLEVRSCGKNLISYPYKETTKTASGITYTDNGNGTININGTATADYISFIFGHSLPLKDGVTYQLSGCNGKLIIKYYNEAGVASWATGLITWRKEYILETVYVQVNTGETFNNVTWYPMVREANTNAEYEPYNGVIGEISADGTVTGLTAISPNMTLATNNDNAELHVNYYRQQSTGVTQYLRNNPFLEMKEDSEITNILDNALTSIYGLNINPFECNWIGNYLVEIGDKISLIAENDNVITTYLVDDAITFDGALGQNSRWEYAEDEAETSDTPTSLGEALNKTFARVDKINNEITLMASEINNNTEQISTLQINTGSISATVSSLETEITESVETLNTDISDLRQEVSTKMTAEDVTISIKNEMSNGVDKVTTETGFTFNNEGLTISKTGKEMTTQITEDGMTVYKDDTAVLTADNTGVDAKNLRASTYLIIGSRSRFEDFGDNRTGCFWIG